LRYELIDKATGSSEVVESYEVLKDAIRDRYQVSLGENLVRASNRFYEFEALPVRYKRKGDSHSHRAVILSEHTWYWPETELEEPMVMLRFEGGRNSDGVAMLRADFDVYYEVE